MQPGSKILGNLLILTFHVLTTLASDSFIKRTTFLGVGYDIRIGNPYGESFYYGGLDPGIKISQNVLENTIVGDDPCPIEAKCTGIYTSESAFPFIDEFEKYQESLENYWSIKERECEACTPMEHTFKLAGSGSNVKREMENFLQQKLVGVFEKETRVHADIKYKPRRRLRLTEDFLEELCGLPQEYDDQTSETHLEFIRNWGTHVITEVRLGEVELGLKFFDNDYYVDHIQDNYKHLTNTTIIDNVLYWTVSTNTTASEYPDIWQSLSGEEDAQDSSYENEFGSETVPVPVSVTLESLTYFISDEFIRKSSRQCSTLTKDNIKELQKSIEKAQLHYLQQPTVYDEEREITRMLEISWPQGSYSLPMAINGCPDGWKSGSTRLDLVNSRNETSWSEHLPQRMKADYAQDPTLYFCTKLEPPTNEIFKSDEEEDDESGLDFYAGSYCILKQKECPRNFHDASIFFPRDYQNPDVEEVGALPLPEKKPTTYYFCCRNDSDATEQINLPIRDPFILFPVTAGTCQEVQGMKWDLQWMVFETEDGLLKDNSVMGHIPPWVERFAAKQPNRNFKIYFCYYFQENP